MSINFVRDADQKFQMGEGEALSRAKPRYK